MADPQSEINRIVAEWQQSRGQSVPGLVEAIYDELRRIARAYMRKERPDHILQTTALVNEAYLRLFQGQPFQWENRMHVVCTMAQTMRRVLVDYARARQAGKRGGREQKLRIDDIQVFTEERFPELLALDHVLDRLGKLNPRQESVVNLRFFSGLTVEETAAVLDVSPETVKLDWRFAKAWLQREMG